jgi:hypothetical protein
VLSAKISCLLRIGLICRCRRHIVTHIANMLPTFATKSQRSSSSSNIQVWRRKKVPASCSFKSKRTEAYHAMPVARSIRTSDGRKFGGAISENIRKVIGKLVDGSVFKQEGNVCSNGGGGYDGSTDNPGRTPK